MHPLNLPQRPQRVIIENVIGGSKTISSRTSPTPYFVTNCVDLELNLSLVCLAQLTLERCRNSITDKKIRIGRVLTSVDFISCNDLEVEFTLDQELSLQLDHCTKINLDLNELKQSQWTVFLFNCDQMSVRYNGEWQTVPLPQEVVNPDGQSVNFRLKVSCKDEALKVETCDQYGIVFETSEENFTK